LIFSIFSDSPCARPMSILYRRPKLQASASKGLTKRGYNNSYV
jgi:hypothetical protein